MLLRPAKVLAIIVAVQTLCVAQGQGADDSYLPIGEGVEWVMAMKVFRPDGKKIEGTGRRKIEGMVERDGKTYFKLKTWTEGTAPFSNEKLIRKDERGFYSIDESEPNSAEQTDVVLPLKVGTSWKSKLSGQSVQNTVVGIETVNIGDKTYENCFHIKIQAANGSYVEDFWEAPKVGSVKSVIQHGNGVKITLTLREFKEATPSQK